MINFDDVAKEDITENNPGSVSGSGKTNSLFHLIGQQPDIDKIYLCAKDPFKAKNQF